MYVKRVLRFVRFQIFYNCYNYLLPYLLTPWSRVLLEKLTGSQVLSQSRNFPHFMEPKGSLPNLQMPATWPYPKLTTVLT